jgi:ABC-type amino acid transport substrate-binding protein
MNAVPNKRTLAELAKFYNVEYLIADIGTVWVDKNFQFAADFDEARLSYYGIMFPKNSKIKNVFDPVIKSYVKSPTYLKFLKKRYGQRIIEYYKEVTKSLDDYEKNISY